MATRVTDLNSILAEDIASDDLIHIVDISDPSDHPDGSSFSITVTELGEAIGSNMTDIIASGDLTVAGDVTFASDEMAIGRFLRHKDDLDTYMNMITNGIYFRAGGNGDNFSMHTNSNILNAGGNKDTYIRTENITDAIFVHSSEDLIEFNTDFKMKSNYNTIESSVPRINFFETGQSNDEEIWTISTNSTNFRIGTTATANPGTLIENAFYAERSGTQVTLIRLNSDEVELNAAVLDFNGDVDISGSLTMAEDELLYFGTISYTIRDDSANGVFLIRNGNSGDEIGIESNGSVYIAIDENNNDTNKEFAVYANGNQADGDKVFSVDELGNVDFFTSSGTNYFDRKADDGAGDITTRYYINGTMRLQQYYDTSSHIYRVYTYNSSGASEGEVYRYGNTAFNVNPSNDPNIDFLAEVPNGTGILVDASANLVSLNPSNNDIDIYLETTSGIALFTNAASNYIKLNNNHNDIDTYIATTNGNAVQFNAGANLVHFNPSNFDINFRVDTMNVDDAFLIDANTDLATFKVNTTIRSTTGNASLTLNPTVNGNDAILDFDVNQSPFRFRANDSAGGNLMLTATGVGDVMQWNFANRLSVAKANMQIDGDLVTYGDVQLRSAGESEFFFLDHSANTLTVTADTNATTDYPLRVANASQSYGLSMGAYGMSNRDYGADGIIFTFEFGDHVYMKFEDDFFFENEAQTFSHVVSNNDFVLRSTAGGDMFQMVDAGAATSVAANPYMEWSYTDAIGNSLTRLGYMGFASGSNNVLTIRNETSASGHIYLDANTGIVKSKQEHWFDEGLTFDSGVNVLEDYEEYISITLVVRGSTTAGSPTYNIREGHYTRNGDVVKVFMDLDLDFNTLAGDIIIYGLPYRPRGDNYSAAVNAINSWGTILTDHQVTINATSSTTYSSNGHAFFRVAGSTMNRNLQRADFSGSAFRFTTTLVYNTSE